MSNAPSATPLSSNNVPSPTAGSPGRDDAGWLLIMLIIFMIVPLQWLDPFAITASSLVIPCLFAGLMVLASAAYRHIRNRADLAAMFIAIAHMILFTAVGSILSYMLTAHGSDAMWDAQLVAWDIALGFDWHAYMAFIDNSPTLATLYSLAYKSLIPQIIILVCALGFSGEVRKMRVVIFAAMLCGLITIILSALMPALGNLAYFGIVPDAYVHIDPRAGYVHIDPVNALRDGSLRTIDLATTEGIITFPSYHAGLAMVTLWGFSRVPLLRVFGVPLATLTIFATPVDGCHYLVDVLGGILIALLSVALARRAVDFDAEALRLSTAPAAVAIRL